MTEYKEDMILADIFQPINNTAEILLNEAEEELIIACMSSYNVSGLLSEVNCMLDRRFINLGLEVEYLQPILNQFVYILDKFLFTQGFKLRNIIDNAQGLFINFMKIETLDEAKYAVQWIVKRMFSNLEENRKIGQNVLIEKIKVYIKRNYYKDITLESVSDLVFLSKFHLSRIFKKENGQAFHNYLIHVRVEAAKKLLAETDFKVKEIALKVGYINDRSFAKIFKRVMGITPGQYREQVQAKNC